MSEPAGISANPVPVAIVGMSCVFPDAPDLASFWRNIVSGHDAIRDVPEGRWDPAVYFSPDPAEEGKVYCKRGGYLEPGLLFDPVRHGIMPSAVEGGEPDQFLVLEVARRALADAGMGDSVVAGERAEFILGRGNYIGSGMCNVVQRSMVARQTLDVIRRLRPDLDDAELAALGAELRASLPPLRPEAAPSLIPNISTGRTANRLGLMGRNFTVDAACASALIAVEIAMQDLRSGACDLALAGGMHIFTNVAFLSVFCALQALSPTGRISPFGRDADGTLPGEGVGLVVLKRLEDARRDGNRVYAVLRAVGSSSDGRATTVIAPRVEGQVLALERAYAQAGIDPRSVGLIEAHGTGTPIGDMAEIESLRRIFGERGGAGSTTAIGSIKSMIGHCMPAAGIAGLIKAALSLHYRTIPPTLNCGETHPKLRMEETPFQPGLVARPWIHGGLEPRRAGVNAFGFGGVNAHAILEESGTEPVDDPLAWDAEALLIHGSDRAEVRARAARLRQYLEEAPDASLAAVACACAARSRAQGDRCLGIVAASGEDLADKLGHALRILDNPSRRQIQDIRGIYYYEEPLARHGRMAFLFPGEGSQYEGMLSELCMRFPEARLGFDRADRISLDGGAAVPPSRLYFPPGGRQRAPGPLDVGTWSMDRAMVGALAANWAMQRIMDFLGIEPDVVAGHSSGEFSAMVAAGILSPEDLVDSFPRLGRAHRMMADDATLPRAAMLAMGAGREAVAELSAGLVGVTLANDNCPHQVIAAGRPAEIETLARAAREKGIFCEVLPFDRGYHTPLLEAICQPLREYFQTLDVRPPRRALYSCAEARPYPADPAAIVNLAVETWIRPVEFRRLVEAMWDDGVRLFIEVGPNAHLTGFVNDILRGRPHMAMPSNAARRPEIAQLCHLACMLAAQGVPFRHEALFAHRGLPRLELDAARDFPPPPPRAHMRLPLDFPLMRLADGGIADRIPAPAAAAPPDWPAMFDPALLAAEFSEGPRDENVEAAMQAHLGAMEKFLEVQRDIMDAFLEGAEASPSAGHSPAAVLEAAPPSEPASIPAIRSALLGCPSLSADATRVEAVWDFDLKQARFLNDHVFGIPGVSDAEPALRPLAIVPMTVTLEAAAEAALLLMTGKTLVGARRLKALRWISVPPEGAKRLRIVAEKRGGDEVHVDVFDSASTDAVATAEVDLQFGAGYPEPPAPPAPEWNDSRPPRCSAQEFYAGRHMFHGPSFQGVVGLEAIGVDGIRGTLRVLPFDELLEGGPSGRWALDPFLLDAAGQLVGYWPLEYLDRGYVVFPVAIDEMRLYAEWPTPGEELDCRARIREVGSHTLTADIGMVDGAGRLRASITGWRDWRFFWPDKFYDFWRNPRGAFVSEPWEEMREAFGAEGGGVPVECRRAVWFFEEGAGLWEEVWTTLVLSRREREEYRALTYPPRRRTEWLAGRTVAKEAARAWLKRNAGLEILPADVEVHSSRAAAPWVDGFWTEKSGGPLALSICHEEGIVGAAVCSSREGCVGVDARPVKALEASFVATAFSESERELLAAAPEGERPARAARLWCAKEALGKAVGKGLVNGPREAAVVGIGADGTAQLELRGSLAKARPDLRGARIAVKTALDPDGVVSASALLPPRPIPAP